MRPKLVLSFRKWCEDMLINENSKDLGKCFIGFACWHIWKERCNAICGHVDVDLVIVCMRINHNVIEFWEMKCEGRTICGNVDLVNCVGSIEGGCWPPKKYVKVNSNGAYDCAFGNSGFGVPVKNSDGVVVNAISETCRVCSTFMVEALGLRKDVNMATCLGLVNLDFELDCLKLILTVKNRLVSTH